MNRDQGLTVEIDAGKLVISIGIDALMIAVKGADTWDERRGYTIDSADGFAADILRALKDEKEDGTTLVHVAFDAAIARALDNGSLNIGYGDDA